MEVFIQNENKKYENEIDNMVFDLNGNNIYMANPKYVCETIKKIKLETSSKLQIIADFDWTLSSFDHHEKERNPTSFDVLHETGFLSPDIKAKCDALKDYYLPFLLDLHLDADRKADLMLEWWLKYNEVMCDTNIHISDIKKMVQNSSAKFRHNADEFFTICDSNSIPISIVSAGVGDIIEEMLIQNINISFHNIKIISNFMEFNENKNLKCFNRSLISVFNKHEALVADKEHLKLIDNRTNVILMGDTEGDHKMAENLENVRNVLKIGFLNTNVDKQLDKYLKLFDIVLVNDSTLDIPNKILKYTIGVL